MKGCERYSIFLFTTINSSAYNLYMPKYEVTQYMDTVFKLVLILDFLLSVYNCCYFLENSVYIPWLAIETCF